MWSFEESVEALRALRHRGWRLGLDRMEELCRRLGVEAGGTPRYIHVAGTNGKGSTVAFCESILQQKYRTGATYSPYVYNVRERITGPEGMISEEDFARAAWEVCRVGEEMEDTEFGGPTEFEAKTAMGFWYWNDQNLDVVVLETGLGGRLDATNIIHPEVSIITSIGLDHTAILGDTVEAIAGEKAGIIKYGVPVVVGQVSDSVAAVFDEVAEEVGAPRPLVFGRDWFMEVSGSELVVKAGHFRQKIGLNKRLKGPIQEINAGTAAMAAFTGDFGFSLADVKKGIEEAFLPGRFEVVEVGDRTWVFDGAHNVDAIRHLLAAWEQDLEGAGGEIVLGMLDGHDPEPVLRELARVGKTIHLVPINWTRTLNPEELAVVARPFFEDVRVHWSMGDAVEAVSGSRVLVTGSFYLLGEVKEALGLK